jgi:integration host factor subunit beta
MNKSDIICRVRDRANKELRASHQQETVADAVNVTLEYIADTLAVHGRIEIRGFGAFSVKTYDGDRFIRNPATGVAGYVKRLPRARFKAGSPLKKAVDVYGGSMEITDLQKNFTTEKKCPFCGSYVIELIENAPMLTSLPPWNPYKCSDCEKEFYVRGGSGA